jgi:hypothetical protein
MAENSERLEGREDDLKRRAQGIEFDICEDLQVSAEC